MQLRLHGAHYLTPQCYTVMHSLPSPVENAKSQWIVPAVGGAIGSAVVGRAVNRFIDRNLCGKREAELQWLDDTDTEERGTKLVALVQVMDEINAAKKSLNALEKLSTKNDRIPSGILWEMLATTSKVQSGMFSVVDLIQQAFVHT